MISIFLTTYQLSGLAYLIFEIIMLKKTGLPLIWRTFLYFYIKSQIERNYLPISWKITGLFWRLKAKRSSCILINLYSDIDTNYSSVSPNIVYNIFGKVKSTNIINEIKRRELFYPTQLKRELKLKELGIK